MLDRQRSTKEVLLIAYEVSAEYAINNTSVYVHEFVHVQSCMVKLDLTSKGHMTNCCQLLITTQNQTAYAGLYHTVAEMNRNQSFETTGLNYLSFSLSCLHST